MPQFLVTGFEAFAGATLNSSKEVIDSIEDLHLDDVVTGILPVEYEGSVKKLNELIVEVKPDVVLALGQAEGRGKVSLERVAINLDDARIPDNSGELRRDQRISESGDLAYMASLPVREISDDLSQRGLPIEVSLSAGSFVCNHLFYEMLRTLAGSRLWMGFIHLPLIDEQAEEFPGKFTLSKKVQQEIIVEVIELSRRLYQERIETTYLR